MSPTEKRIRSMVLRPLATQYGSPKWLDNDNQPQYVDQWVNALKHFDNIVLQKAVDKALLKFEFMPKISQFVPIANDVQRVERLKKAPALPAPQKQCPKLRKKLEAWHAANRPSFVGDTLKVINLNTLTTIVTFSATSSAEVKPTISNSLAALKSIDVANRETLTAYAEALTQYMQTLEKQES